MTITAPPLRLSATGGLASTTHWRTQGLSYVPDHDGPGHATAVADAWAPPSPMALSAEECDAVRAFALEHGRAIDVADGITGWLVASSPEGEVDRSPLSTQLMAGRSLPASLFDPIVDRLRAANAQWWGLDVDHWTMTVKRYTRGGEHRAHADLFPDPDAEGRKVCSSIQLSKPSDYTGGRFVVRQVYGPEFPKVVMPRELGTVIAFPPWTVHEVEPVQSGERWVLLVIGYGERLR